MHHMEMTLGTASRICTVIRNGIVFLTEKFKCPLDLPLACTVLHALPEAKYRFLLLSYSEQVDLVEKILTPLWVGGMGSPPTELNDEQRDLLFISYVVGRWEELHYSKLIGMSEKHQMGMSVLMETDDYFDDNSAFFTMNKDGYIKLIHFPPVKWMTARLASVVSGSPNFSLNPSGVVCRIPHEGNTKPDMGDDFRVDSAEISKTVNPCFEGIVTEKYTRRTSNGFRTRYRQSRRVDVSFVIDRLSLTIHNSIVYLRNFFHIEIYPGFLELVLHASDEWITFFALPTAHREKVIEKSFREYRIDEYGNISFPYNTKSRERCRLSRKRRMPLFLAYLVSPPYGSMHYQEVFDLYHARVGGKRMTDSNRLQYLRQRKDLFLVSDQELVSLVKFPSIGLDYVSILKSKISESKVFPPSICGCSKNGVKERKTMNFFIISLGRSKIGFSISALKRELRTASIEVQHYISCVYKGNILNFLQGHDAFCISPISGNVRCFL